MMDIIIPVFENERAMGYVYAGIALVALGAVGLLSLWPLSKSKKGIESGDVVWDAGLFCIPLVVGLLLFAASSDSIDAANRADTAESIQMQLYEQHGVGNLVTSGKSDLDADSVKDVMCFEDGPAPYERPRTAVDWIGADGVEKKGHLTNMGNVNGECLIILSDGNTRIGQVNSNGGWRAEWKVSVEKD